MKYETTRALPSLFFVAVLALSPHVMAQQAPVGDWRFEPIAKDAILKSHNDQIGTLNETKDRSNFVTVPVIVRKSVGLSMRPASAQLIRLEAEVNSIMHREKSKPVQTSKRAVGERGTFEATYGKVGKGFTWVYATVRNDAVLLLIGVSRSSKPPKTAGEEFFKMAREFTPPE